jgi:hypothetical protein
MSGGEGSEAESETGSMHDDVVLIEGGVGGFLDDVI